MAHMPHALPFLDGVTRVGVFAPLDGFDKMKRSLDVFCSEGGSLVIRLGEALLPMRVVAGSTHVNRLGLWLSQSRQALLVCTDDLGRTAGLRRFTVRPVAARTIRSNIVHFDPGLTTSLFNRGTFVFVGANPAAWDFADESLVGGRTATGIWRVSSGWVGLAVSTTPTNMSEDVRWLAARLLISAGAGAFLDDTQGGEDPVGDPVTARVIVFGDRDGQRINHAVIHLTDGRVIPVPHPAADRFGTDTDRGRTADS
jgi:hypothetical protein